MFPLFRRTLAPVLLMVLGLAGGLAHAQIPPGPLPGVPEMAGAGENALNPAPVLPAPLACDARKTRMVEWTPLPSAVLSDRQRDDLWDESNLHGYLGPCDAITLLPELDRIQAALEDPSHEDQLRCLWDLGLLGAARATPLHDPRTGTVIPVLHEVVDAVLAECSAAVSAHQDGYLNDQMQSLDRWRSRNAGTPTDNPGTDGR